MVKGSKICGRWVIRIVVRWGRDADSQQKVEVMISAPTFIRAAPTPVRVSPNQRTAHNKVALMMTRRWLTCISVRTPERSGLVA